MRFCVAIKLNQPKTVFRNWTLLSSYFTVHTILVALVSRKSLTGSRRRNQPCSVHNKLDHRWPFPSHPLRPQWIFRWIKLTSVRKDQVSTVRQQAHVRQPAVLKHHYREGLTSPEPGHRVQSVIQPLGDSGECFYDKTERPAGRKKGDDYRRLLVRKVCWSCSKSIVFN